jgi:hypothetical protein
MEQRFGRVTQVSPLRVRVQGDATDAPAEKLGSDFTGVTVNTEVVVTVIGRRRLAQRVY